MSQLPRYESYKDSGVQWLGEIPSHWDTTVLKFECDVRDGTHDTPEYVNFDENTYPLITSKDLVTGDISFENLKYISQEDFTQISKRSKVDFGDLLMPMIGTVGGAVLVKTKELIAIKNVALFKPTKVSAKWLKYFLDSELTKIQFDLQKTGGVQSFVSLGTLRNLRLLKVPLDEQKIIADFLDKRLAQVDALIAKQETLLEKLAEQRVALISHAVTKGLNPDVEMKESDVEWLGNIPKHWDTKKLKFSVGCNLKTLTDKTDSDYEILYVDISNVSLTAGIKNKEELLFENAPSRARRVVKSGDVLVSTVRTYLKAITYVESAEDNLIASTGFAVLSPLDILDSKFLGYWIQSSGMIGSIVANSVGVSYPAINSSVLVSLPIVDIPLEEQKAISSYLDMEIETINRQVKLVNSSIEKLKEYRSTLITQVVTGKIDVRNLKLN